MTDDEIVALVRSEGRETRRHVDQVVASVEAVMRVIAEDQRSILDKLRQELDARTADSLDVRADLRGVTRELLRLRRQGDAEIVALRADVLAALGRLPGGAVEPGRGAPD